MQVTGDQIATCSKLNPMSRNQNNGTINTHRMATYTKCNVLCVYNVIYTIKHCKNKAQHKLRCRWTDHPPRTQNRNPEDYHVTTELKEHLRKQQIFISIGWNILRLGTLPLCLVPATRASPVLEQSTQYDLIPLEISRFKSKASF